MAPVPTPLDPSPGDINSATKFDAGVRDALAFILTNRPRCHAYDNTGVTLTDGADTLLPLSGEVYDSDNMHNLTATPSPSRITFNTAGTYDIRIGVQLPSATYTVSNINARVNSFESNSGGTAIGPFLMSGARFITASFTYQFALNDHFQIWINQSSGGTARVTTVGPMRTFIQVIWLSN
jgi:hypothetical protein